MSTGTILDKKLKEDKLNYLKASEISKVKKEEHSSGAIGCLLLATLFLFLVGLTAMFLWFNKITIFISIVLFLVNIPVFGIAYMQFRDYNKLVNKIVNRVNNVKENL